MQIKTLQDFKASLGFDPKELLKDVQLSDTQFARIYTDGSVYISDPDYEDYEFTREEMMKLIDAYLPQIRDSR